MPKKNYKFNKKSLQFEEVKITFKARALKVLSVIATGSVFASVVIFLAYTFLDSPKEKMLKRENAFLLDQITEFKDKLDKVDAVLADFADRDDNIYRIILEAEPMPSAMLRPVSGAPTGIPNLRAIRVRASSLKLLSVWM